MQLFDVGSISLKMVPLRITTTQKDIAVSGTAQITIRNHLRFTKITLFYCWLFKRVSSSREQLVLGFSARPRRMGLKKPPSRTMHEMQNSLLHLNHVKIQFIVKTNGEINN